MCNIMFCRRDSYRHLANGNYKTHQYTVCVIFYSRERGPKRLLFLDGLLDGKTEDGTSYYEFISHILRQIGK